MQKGQNCIASKQLETFGIIWTYFETTEGHRSMLPSALPKKLGSGRLLWHCWEISSLTPFWAQKGDMAGGDHGVGMCGVLC